ncbi:hypothetical protein E1B28_004071 [Marasmius oreades]|uniref:SnoaL-like domain-containing protein n=1 Tax=Marasmius oreades TaxID=181124 RepID=A0A9P8ABS8_9AGAR|nr:uncharacterized protein E1B28_004071 [Marasmius oreades]KAG7096656.1 hypothetical protein E1B28_004071 [Marasmius oreades]
MELSLRAQLQTSAQSFCNALADNKDLDTVMSHFSTTHQVTAIEHGEKALAPFLGREYAGAPAIRSYFETIGSLLSYEEMEFVEFVVDSHSRRVACKARAKFTWKSTGESWEEKFAYMLDFDDEKKITDYQVWADSGAAYLARIGKLDEVRKVRKILASLKLSARPYV